MRVELFTDLEGDHRDDWDRLTFDSEFAPGILETIDQTVTPITYAIAYDGDVAVAATSMTVKRLDLLTLSGLGQVSGVKALRSRTDRPFSVMAIVIGLPVSWGARVFASPAGPPAGVLVPAFLRAASTLHEKYKTRLTLFKEFLADDLEGLARIDPSDVELYVGSTPDHFDLYLPGTSFDDYLGDMRASYRQDVVRSLKKATAEGLVSERFFGIEAVKAYGMREHTSICAVHEKAEVQFEDKLPYEYYVRLATALGDRLSLTILTDRSGILLACCWSIIGESSYKLINCGVNYSENRRVDSYFNMFYEEIKNAYASERYEVHISQTAEVFKARIGGVPTPRYVGLAARGPVLTQIFRLAHESLFPMLEPLQAKNVFRSSSHASHSSRTSPASV